MGQSDYAEVLNTHGKVNNETKNRRAMQSETIATNDDQELRKTATANTWLNRTEQNMTVTTCRT